MPAPLDVDREAVKAHALQHGVREAARAFGLPEPTVQSWSIRERWLEPLRVTQAVQVLPKSIAPRASSATTASQAALSTMQRRGERTKNGLTKGLMRAAQAVGRMDGETVLRQAQNVRHVTAAADTLHGWTAKATPSGPTLNLALFSGVRPDQLPVIDAPT
jgi:hypothetical protein